MYEMSEDNECRLVGKMIQKNVSLKERITRVKHNTVTFDGSQEQDCILMYLEQASMPT